jgi:hypothetical protein
MLQVIPKQASARGPQRFLHRGHLDEHIGAVPFLLDHLLETPHLTLDAAEPVKDGGLDLGVDRDGAAARP